MEVDSLLKLITVLLVALVAGVGVVIRRQGTVLSELAEVRVAVARQDVELDEIADRVDLLRPPFTDPGERAIWALDAMPEKRRRLLAALHRAARQPRL